jgi:hypothetical protein
MGLILQALPDNDTPLLFMGINDLRPARAGPTQYNFEAEFLDNSNPQAPIQFRKPYFALVNLAFLPLFLPSSEWKAKQKLRDSHVKCKRIGPIMGAEFSQFAELFSGFSLANGKRAIRFEQRGPLQSLGPGRRFNFGSFLLTGKKNSYFIPTSEIVRFYVAAFGSIFYELVTAVSKNPIYDREELLNNLVHFDKCFWLDETTLLIAPRAGLVDRVSAVQLALLFTDNEMLRTIWFMARALYLQAQFEKDSALLSILPQDTNGGFDFEVGDPIENISGGGTIKTMTPIRKIKRDNRAFKFSRLVIDVPGLKSAKAFTSVELPSGELVEIPYVGDDVKVTEELSIKGSPRSIGDFGPSFSDCFPAVSQVKFQIQSQEGLRAQHRRRVRVGMPTQKTTVTLNSVSSADGVPGYKTSDSSWLDEADCDQETSFKGNFFPADLPQGDVKIEHVPRHLLSARLLTFAKLRTVLVQEHRIQNIFEDEGSELEPLIVPPKSWGQFAHSCKLGPRRIGVICLKPDYGRTFYAIELGQLVSNEYVSMAVLGRTDGKPMPMSDLHAVLFWTCRSKQTSRPGTNTIWPIQFRDLDVAPLNHHAKLYRPLALREKILTAAAGLTARGLRRSTLR